MNPWFKVAQVALLVAAGFFLGAATWKVIKDGQIATLKQGFAQERQATAESHAKAADEARKREQDLQSKVNELEAKDANSAVEIARRDARIKSLVATGSVLNAKLAAYTAPRGRAEDSCPAAVDLQNRVETLGLLVAERDRMAGESEQYADDVGDELRTCRAYSQTVSQP